MHLGIWLYDGKDPGLRVTEELVGILRRLDIPFCVREDQRCAALSGVRALDRERFLESIGALLVLGGDGSVLAAARECAPRGIPMLGINLGHRGFMTECEPGQMEEGLRALMEGRYRVEERMMLHVGIYEGDRLLWEADALNDVTLANRQPIQIIRAAASIDGELVERFSCDAVIVASPTGSTAYSMAAGGPVIHPRMQCMVLTPVCASTLTAKPIVLAAEDRLSLELTEPDLGGLIAADGQTRFPLDWGQRAVISRSERTAGLIRVYDRNFYQLFREKRDQWARDQYSTRG